MSKREHPAIPTPEQCSVSARLEDFEGCPAYACWYPQMGGYVGKAVVVITTDANGEFVKPDEECYDRCFEVYVWHDGAFPFDEEYYGEKTSPKHLHHCMPSQFVEFGEFVQRLQGKSDEQV